MEETKSCVFCEHSIFDPRWGEVKCKRYQHKIYYPEFYAEDCPNYKKAKEIDEHVNKHVRKRPVPSKTV